MNHSMRAPVMQMMIQSLSPLSVQIPHRGTADQGLPSGALGTQNKSSHQSQHDSGTAL